MRPMGELHKLFLTIKKVGQFVDVKQFDYDSQIYMSTYRFNASKKINGGRRLSVKSMKDENGAKFFRVFLVQKESK